MKQPPPDTRIHYGWLIVAAGTFCIFAGLGFGRFAIGMLLPSMSASLHLSYSQMGLISTGNFAGYLVAVLLCGGLVARTGTRLIIFLALLLVGSTMILISRANGFWPILWLYMLTGVGSGASNVPMMALLSTWFASRQRGRAAGFVVIGSGFAILLSGKLIPLLNRLSGQDGWRLSWLILGTIVLAVAGLCLLIIRNSPEELGLRPYGCEQDTPAAPIGERLQAPPEICPKTVWHLGMIYFLFGYTYVIYATFIVTTLVQERGFSEAVAGNFWSAVGLLSLFSGPVFGTLSDKLGRRAGLVTVFAIQMLSYLLIAIPLPPVFLYLSIGLYGIVAWSIPSIMAALVGDYAGPQKAARVFGFITFIFAIGQIAGPAMAGVLAEKLGGFSSSFMMAGVFAGLAILLCLGLKRKITG